MLYEVITDLTIYNTVNDEQIELGKTKTNMNGESKIVIKEGINAIKPDSTNVYNIEISFDGNDSFSRASKTLSFKDANIEAKLITNVITSYSIHYTKLYELWASTKRSLNKNSCNSDNVGNLNFP